MRQETMAISEEDVQKYDDTLEPMEKRWQAGQEEFFIMSHSYVEVIWKAEDMFDSVEK